MEERKTPRMHKYGESKTTQIMMAIIYHVTPWAGRTKYQAAWFLLNWMYMYIHGNFNFKYKSRECGVSGHKKNSKHCIAVTFPIFFVSPTAQTVVRLSWRLD